MINKETKFNIKKSLLAVAFGFISALIIAAIIKPDLFLKLLISIFIEPLGASHVKKVGILTSILIIVSLGMSISFKARLFNIGIPGQMLAGAMVPAILASSIAKGGWFPGAWILFLIIGFIFGGLIGGLAGYLKSKFNVHEVIATIMLNWIVYYVGKTVFKHPTLRNVGTPGSKTFHFSLRVNVIICLIIAWILMGLVWYLFNKTKLGYKITLVGEQASVARYAGYSETKIQTLTLAMSGALAGIAGVIYYGTYTGQYAIPIFDKLDPIGFNAIIVSLVAFKNPIFIGFVALLFAVIYTGGTLGFVYFRFSGELMALAFGLMMIMIAMTDNYNYQDKKVKKGGK